jgi:hypothetical protein
MGKTITISVGRIAAQAELNDSPCASAVAQALPIESTVNTWGDEVYFDTSVTCPLAKDARSDMEVGELAYWPPGEAVCIFFGPTPASGKDGKPRAASKVNPIGRVAGDATVFREARDGERIVLSAKA